LLIAWLFALPLAQPPNQDVLPPEMRLLVKIKQRMAANLTNLPNYVCLAAIERFRDSAKTGQWERVDSHQLEVALVGDDEWFSRPGAGRLETRDLRELIPTGLLSTGDYANHARSVFLSAMPRFEHAGIEDLGGRATARFRYSVSLLNSGYRLRSGQTAAIVAFHGSFWADPATGDVRRLEIVADDIPPEVGISDAATTVDYQRVAIGQAGFLLPERTELTVGSRLGYAERNRMTFSQCRQYGTESAISFDPPETLPAGLTLTLELDPGLPLERLRGGDAVQAKVAAAVQSNGNPLIPAGAPVRGRVLHIERRPGPPAQIRVALEFEEIAAGERRFHFTAVLERVVETRQTRRAPESTVRPGVLPLVAEAPFRIGGLVSTWRSQ
jgi:hypothetical protein